MRFLLNPNDWLAQHPRLMLSLLVIGYVAVCSMEAI